MVERWRAGVVYGREYMCSVVLCSVVRCCDFFVNNLFSFHNTVLDEM